MHNTVKLQYLCERNLCRFQGIQLFCDLTFVISDCFPNFVPPSVITEVVLTITVRHNTTSLSIASQCRLWHNATSNLPQNKKLVIWVQSVQPKMPTGNYIIQSFSDDSKWMIIIHKRGRPLLFNIQIRLFAPLSEQQVDVAAFTNSLMPCVLWKLTCHNCHIVNTAAMAVLEIKWTMGCIGCCNTVLDLKSPVPSLYGQL